MAPVRVDSSLIFIEMLFGGVDRNYFFKRFYLSFERTYYSNVLIKRTYQTYLAKRLLDQDHLLCRKIGLAAGFLDSV